MKCGVFWSIFFIVALQGKRFWRTWFAHTHFSPNIYSLATHTGGISCRNAWIRNGGSIRFWAWKMCSADKHLPAVMFLPKLWFLSIRAFESLLQLVSVAIRSVTIRSAFLYLAILITEMIYAWYIPSAWMN